MRFLDMVVPSKPAPLPTPAASTRAPLTVRTGLQAGSSALFDSQNNGAGARCRRKKS